MPKQSGPLKVATGWLLPQSQLEQALVYSQTGLPDEVTNSVALWVGMRQLYLALQKQEPEARRDFAQKLYEGWAEANEAALKPPTRRGAPGG